MADYNNQQTWDSVWEQDKENEEPKSKKVKTSNQDSSEMPNLQFYQNKIPFKPNGEYIDVMHQSWRDDYYKLETNHNFIQWLFPLREPGVNWQATPLTLSEIQLMKMDKEVMKRLLESYKLMLGFYGIELLNEDTGEVARAEKNWKDRFDNLNYNTHNNLRITRILKCLGEMGYEKFQAPLVLFFLKESLCNGNLPNVKKSALDYFIFAVKDKEERQKLVHFAQMQYKPQVEFIWGPVKKLKEWKTVLNYSVDSPEKPNMPMIASKNSSSECQRDANRGLVRKPLGYISWLFLFIFRLLSSPFMAFFRLRPFRFFRGYSYWFRRKARNGDRLNEELFSVKTESSRNDLTTYTNIATANISVGYKDRSQGVIDLEHERLLKSPKGQESHKTKLKEQVVSDNGKSENSLDDMEKGAKLGTEDNKYKHESVPENGTGSEDSKLIVNTKMPDSIQDKEDDNDTESKDDLGNLEKDIQRKMKNEEQFSVKADSTRTEKTRNANISVEYEDISQEVMESEHERLLQYLRRQESHQTKQEADVSVNGKSNNSLDEVEMRAKLETENNRSKHENVPENVTGSEDRKLMVNTKISHSKQDKEDDNDTERKDDLGNLANDIQRKNDMKSVEDPYSRNERLERTEEGCAKEDDNIENVENSDEPVKDFRRDNGCGEKEDGCIANEGHQWRKTEDEGASNEELVLPSSGEGEFAESTKFSKIEGNREATTVRSKDNDLWITGLQNIEPEKEKTEHVERADQSRADMYSNSETREMMNETQEPGEGSKESVCTERLNKQERFMEPESERLLQRIERQCSNGNIDNRLDIKLRTEDNGSKHESLPES